MKKLIPFLLSSVLVVGAVGCSNSSKTAADAPSNTSESAKTPDTQASQANKNDAQNQTRKNQVNSDIRAEEQRNNALNGGGANKGDNPLSTEVRDKLEANIPNSQLVVQAKEGVVTVSGTVAHQHDMTKIEPLSKQIKGVKSVVNKATLAPAKNKS
ncbi:MAG: hypothetical protein NVS2B14_18240 [Chamaesiphon sp.]